MVQQRLIPVIEDHLRQMYARAARLRFDNGYTSYIEVLDSERHLFTSELYRAQTKGDLFQSLVNLYKTMGGGWVVEAERFAAPAPVGRFARGSFEESR